MSPRSKSSLRSLLGNPLFLLCGFIAASVVALVAGLLILFYVVHPDPGPELVSKHIDAGTPFELRYVSNGEAQRMFIDMDCEPCNLSRLEGTVEVSRAGVLIDRHSIENTGIFRAKKASRPKDPRVKIYGNELCSIPAQPAGSEVVVRGTLEPRSRSGPPWRLEYDPRPKIYLFRIFIAP